jgi:predicted DCC family thiol-disulfide oxidoreductase YuxK
MSSEVLGRDAPILVFDGSCVLCNGTVRWVLKHERATDIVFAATQSGSGAALLQRAGLDPSNPQTFLFIENDRVLLRTQAAIALAAHLRAPWRWLQWLRFIPRGLRDAAYDWIARNRFRLFGRAQSCVRPAPQQMNRFLP